MHPTSACRLILTAQQASQSAGMVVRGLGAKAVAPEPQVTLFGTSPLVEIKGGGVIFIERLDQPGERQKIDTGGRLLKIWKIVQLGGARIGA